ncbi:Cof subfamily protein (haloacid dehalogenase superfamily) [Kibdelosporangium banguiense]|uniref:Cof subfamily protein (Haloacid dehalogenase superfamily) n=1 Tax=Kibdelosporangium banguiense TaxID=1365924 RepID=A0ABS4TB51_9PSEU|nr:HAD family hydrolase [Kibdelosporangium banguiense]MBP2321648.1 Cof subfamily protein (haloacid dehalogenase superfamily) [Kibdelosporangium banguiense]
MQKPGLIASDVDGTLLDVTEQVSARTAAVVTRVTAAGTPFVLVSGRPPRWIPSVAEQAGLTGYAVCANGAVLYDIGADRVLSAYTLDPVTLHDVANALREVLPGMAVATERYNPNGTLDSFVAEHDYISPWGDADKLAKPRAEVLGHEAVKLLVRHDRMTSEEMAAVAIPVLRGSVNMTFSTSRGLIEVSKLGVTKATGLAEAAKLFSVDVADVVAFGDMPNDIPMLEWAGHGVAMANGHPDVLAVADEIAAANSQDGVAQVLERWF